METQAYHIQILLANKLDRCKEKEKSYTIKEIQEAYKIKHQEIAQPEIIDKWKQRENWV